MPDGRDGASLRTAEQTAAAGFPVGRCPTSLGESRSSCTADPSAAARSERGRDGIAPAARSYDGEPHRWHDRVVFDPMTQQPRRGGATFRAVSLPVLAGLLVRAIPVLTADFPLNDGGLFYAMTRDLQHANFLLPATTSYNGLGIPFAYPPLGFYVAGVAVQRLRDRAAGRLPVPAADHRDADDPGRLPRRPRDPRDPLPGAAGDLGVRASCPRASTGSIAGGGVTRSLGLLLAFLAILEGDPLLPDRPTPSRRVAMAVFAALTALSHPEVRAVHRAQHGPDPARVSGGRGGPCAIRSCSWRSSPR